MEGQGIGGSGNSGIRDFPGKTSRISRKELFPGTEINILNREVGNVLYCTMGTQGTVIIPPVYSSYISPASFFQWCDEINSSSCISIKYVIVQLNNLTNNTEEVMTPNWDAPSVAVTGMLFYSISYLTPLNFGPLNTITPFNFVTPLIFVQPVPKFKGDQNFKEYVR